MKKMTDYTFAYSQDFKELIIDLHRGKEHLPDYQKYIADHLGDINGRLNIFEKYLCPEIRYHCGDLSSKRVLDFGCGTGATTAVIAMNCMNVVAYDIDAKSIRICQKRLHEHGLIDRVSILCAPDFEEVIRGAGTFDIILLNGVIEHIPLSCKGLRKKLLLKLFDILNPQGYLYINETPNRLWPIDSHTTKLWWIPWSKPGSEWAYKKAVKMGRHADNPASHTDGPLGLEERGAWGATYFEIKNYFQGRHFRIINSLPGHNRHLSYLRSMEDSKRQIIDSFIYYFFTKWTKIPITAIWSGIQHLIIQKCEK